MDFRYYLVLRKLITQLTAKNEENAEIFLCFAIAVVVVAVAGLQEDSGG